MDVKSFLTKPRNVWQKDETRILFKSWKKNLYIKRFIKNHHSKHPFYLAISEDLKKHGFDRSVAEVEWRRKNLCTRFKRSKGPQDFPFYKEMCEILNMESNNLKENNTGADFQKVHTTEQPETVLDGSHTEGSDSENIQVIRLGVPDHQNVSNPSPQTYTVINHLGQEIQNAVEVIEVSNLPNISRNNPQKTSGNILLRFYQEFERSNRQLEKNDAAMLELFKEQNDIFRTQTTLLMKLLSK